MLYGAVSLAEPGTVMGDEWCTSRLDPDTKRPCMVRSNIGLSGGDCSKLSRASEGDSDSDVYAFYNGECLQAGQVLALTRLLGDSGRGVLGCLVLVGDACRFARDRRLRSDPNSFLRFEGLLQGDSLPLQRSSLAPKSSRSHSAVSWVRSERGEDSVCTAVFLLGQHEPVSVFDVHTWETCSPPCRRNRVLESSSLRGC